MRKFVIETRFHSASAAIHHSLIRVCPCQGRQYDGSGNMRNWWRNDTLLAYKERTTCLETEYGNLTTETGEHINGVQTLGENIADNGGLKAAFRAFTSLRPEQRTWTRGLLPGLNLTSNQMFFLSFAQVWCDVSTPQAWVNILQNAPRDY